MKNSDSSLSLFVSVLFAISIVGCTENQITPNTTTTISTIPREDIFDGPDGDLPEGVPESDWDYPYPDIISREFIPPQRWFADTKCLAWRITWPEYKNSADENKIPTIFGINGALNSFDYLNSVAPGNTHDKVFSLYYNNKLETAAVLWAELDHADLSLMDVPFYVLSDEPLDNIIYWVTERPSLFETLWPGFGPSTEEVDYSEGDFIQFALLSGHYGGIRIVSMTPRIIEIYLAVPNL